MKRYTKLYLEYHGYTTADFIPCAVCGRKAVDLHHIEARGMGGSRHADRIDNLIALCREHHIEYGDKKQHVEYLKSLIK